MRCAVALLCGAGAAAATAPPHPKLPQQWTSVERIEQVTNQGGLQDGEQVCCEMGAPQCKLQTQHVVRHFYFDGPNNRTRSGKAGTKGAMISLYHEKKEVQVDENNACTSYCPLPTHKLGRFHVQVNATYGGAATVDGKAADMWTWTDYAMPKLHLLPIQVTNFYVSTGAHPVPLKQVELLEPLGQQIGTNNETWADFAVGVPEADLFKVSGLKGCPVDKNCQQSDRVSHRRRSYDTDALDLYSAAEAAAPAATTAADPPARPALPQQWSALQNENLLINQGGDFDGDRACCSFSAAQCKVQSAHASGQFYFDGPNNRTRTGPAGAASAIVSDYVLGKEMQVDENNTCTSYCPLQGALAPWGVAADAAYLGRGDVDGDAADMWKWTEYAVPKLHLGVMQVTTFFVSTDPTPVPLKEEDILEPLGQLLGTQNTTWFGWKAGAPAASLFTVHGASACPEDDSCQQQARIEHRRRSRTL